LKKHEWDQKTDETYFLKFTIPLTYRLSVLTIAPWRPDMPVILKVEFEQEVDGRWIAEIPHLPGVMVYGATKEEALAKVRDLARRVLAEKEKAGECEACSDDVAFAV
jgi:predicted RNase H-like HicB family nuclease